MKGVEPIGSSSSSWSEGGRERENRSLDPLLVHHLLKALDDTYFHPRASL